MTRLREKAESAKGRARKALLLEIATRLIARNGSRGTTLAEIADEAGVSQAGLLYHFPSKEALLHAVLDRRDAADEYLHWEEGDEPGLDIVNRIVRAVRHWSRQADRVGMHSVLVAENAGRDSPLHPRLLERYGLTIERLASTLDAGKARGEIRGDLATREKAIEMIAFINGLETAWLVDPSIPAAATAEQWAADQTRSLSAGASAKAAVAGGARAVGRRGGRKR